MFYCCIHEYFHGNNFYETMYHLFNYWSFLYIYSCNLGGRIQDSNVSDLKFGWLDLFASRMSSYLNVLFTRWLQVDTLDGAGPVKAWSVFCSLFTWGFVDCSVRSSVLGSCMGVLTCTYFTHNKVLPIISALFFNPNLCFLPGSIWIWRSAKI